MCTLEVFGIPDGLGNVVVRCPLGTHPDHNPSGSYNVNTGLFYCFSCKQGMNKKQLEALVGEITLESITSQDITKRHRVSVSELWRAAYDHGTYTPNPAMKKYMTNRRFDLLVYGEYGIKFQEDSIMFPNMRNHSSNTIVGFQERVVGDRSKFGKYKTHGEVPLLWPTVDFTSYANWKRVYLTEGVFGTIRLRMMGLPAFSVMGTKLKYVTRVIGRLLSLGDQYSRRTNIVAAFDKDKPGQRAAWEYMKQGCSAYLPGAEIDEMDHTNPDIIRNLLANNTVTMNDMRTNDELKHRLIEFNTSEW